MTGVTIWIYLQSSSLKAADYSWVVTENLFLQKLIRSLKRLIRVS